MQAIIIAFTLKGQDFEKIEKVLAEISSKKLHPILAIHGFMPRRVLIEKNFPLNVVNALDKHFPMQLNMYYDGQPLRQEMAVVGRKLDATVHLIGEMKEGVAEEIDLYKREGLAIRGYPI